MEPVTDSLRDRVLEWLRSKGPDDVVGLRWRPSCCPLAGFMQEVHGVENPAVHAQSYRVGHGKRQPLSEWARAARAAIDNSGGRSSVVTASEALALLEAL